MKYIISRIVKMDYKEFFNKVSEISKENNKNKIIVFFDIIYCGFKYGAGYMDYYLFNFINLTKEERKTFITRGINNTIVQKLNDPNKMKIFTNKVSFNKKFSKYLNRRWLYLDDNFKEFEEFIKTQEYIFCKPLALRSGEGIEKYKVSDFKPKKLYNTLIEKNQLLVEELAVQHKQMSKIHPASVNTIRVITINNGKSIKILAAIFRIGNNNSVVDNLGSGGMSTYVNVDTGEVEFPAIDKFRNVYEVHPITNEKIVGFKIPIWDDVKKLCIEAASVVDGVGYIGWDVCVGEKHPYLIEGNEFSGHRVLQLPIRENQKVGLYPKLKEIMEDK